MTEEIKLSEKDILDRIRDIKENPGIKPNVWTFPKQGPEFFKRDEVIEVFKKMQERTDQEIVLTSTMYVAIYDAIWSLQQSKDRLDKAVRLAHSMAIDGTPQDEIADYLSEFL